MNEGKDILILNKETETCPNCRNIFRVELLKKSPVFNDFGFRYCPFCGTIIDEWAHIKNKL